MNLNSSNNSKTSGWRWLALPFIATGGLVTYSSLSDDQKGFVKDTVVAGVDKYQDELHRQSPMLAFEFDDLRRKFYESLENRSNGSIELVKDFRNDIKIKQDKSKLITELLSLPKDINNYNEDEFFKLCTSTEFIDESNNFNNQFADSVLAKMRKSFPEEIKELGGETIAISDEGQIIQLLLNPSFEDKFSQEEIKSIIEHINQGVENAKSISHPNSAMHFHNPFPKPEYKDHISTLKTVLEQMQKEPHASSILETFKKLHPDASAKSLLSYMIFLNQTRDTILLKESAY